MNISETLLTIADQESDNKFRRTFTTLRALLSKDSSEEERMNIMNLLDKKYLAVGEFPEEDRWIRYIEVEVENLIAYHIYKDKIVQTEVEYWHDKYTLSEMQRKELSNKMKVGLISYDENELMEQRNDEMQTIDSNIEEHINRVVELQKLKIKLKKEMNKGVEDGEEGEESD